MKINAYKSKMQLLYFTSLQPLGDDSGLGIHQIFVQISTDLDIWKKIKDGIHILLISSNKQML